MSKEDTEHMAYKTEMAKLQTAEKALSSLENKKESLALIRAQINEVRKKANGGIELSRAEKAQGLLKRKNHKVKTNKWLKQQIQACGTKLMDLNA
eukprot:6690124-Heterocapsa_arctica.AAC.1